MKPATPLARSMTRVVGSRQWRPRDGDPVSERTEACQGNLTVRWFVTRSVRLEGTYLLSRISEASGRRVFDNHIGRARLSWQLTPRLNLRSIVEYNSIEADPELSTLETRKNLNVDVLGMYQVDPWTAVYVGYNNNQTSFRLLPAEPISELVPGYRLGPDSWQFFAKISYLFRF